MNYIKTHMFTGWLDGKITRKPFILLQLLIIVALVVFGAVFVLGLVGAEAGVVEWFDLPLMEAQDKLRGALSLPAVIVVFGFYIALSVIIAALCAKRVRDIGLPGWPVAILAIVVDAVLLRSFDLGLIYLLVLVVTPSAIFNVKLPYTGDL